ncbi:MAG: nicotinate-nucleotide pyrophosphorylase [Syntrophales bacterium]
MDINGKRRQAGDADGRFIDVRAELLKYAGKMRVAASIIADEDGVIAGTKYARAEIERIGLNLLMIVNDGDSVKVGQEICRFAGTPEQILMAEETVIGQMAKPSGIATSASRFVKATGGRPKVVSGAWKKMPFSLKESIREAVKAGGAAPRIVSEPFAYLDKNYVEILGGIKSSVSAADRLQGFTKVIQVKGRYCDIVTEACEAAKAGADVIFVDSGNLEDVCLISEGLHKLGLRDRIKLALGGGITMGSIEAIKATDVDIIDVGRQIIDAPILDMRLEIICMDK